MSNKDAALPVIDLAELDNAATRDQFYAHLRDVARDIGFFYLVGHGVQASLREELLEVSKEFFALPQAEKDKIDMSNSPYFRGYTKNGDERTRNATDFREQIDIGEELPPVDVDTSSEPWLNLIGPNQWPEKVPRLKGIALEYQARVREVSVKLLRAFLVALEQPEDALDSLITGVPQQLLKLVHYPPNDGQPSSNGDSKLQGCGPHKDNGILTLLWQDRAGGLQVETEKGWIDIPYVENSFIINIGEVLELVTDGYLRANVHQVVRPVSNKSRYSIPYFLTPNVSAKTVPLLPLPPRLKELARGPEADPLNPLFDNLGKNLIKSRFRSHLAVTKRFYPDVYEDVILTGNVR